MKDITAWRPSKYTIKAGKIRPTKDSEEYDCHRYTGYALERFAELSGFSVETIEPFGGTIEVLADIICKKINFLNFPVLGRIFVSLIQNLALCISSNSFFKGPVGKTPKYFPLGTLLS